MPTTIPCLWFDHGQAEQAAAHYTAIFPNSGIDQITRYGPDAPGGIQEGAVMTVEFSLDGQRYTALDGGPQFRFTEAVSFQVMCADQAEIDHYWERLGDGGEPSQCGWLKDRFGVSWQVVPEEWLAMITHPDPARAQRAFAAILTMQKIDIAELHRAVQA